MDAGDAAPRCLLRHACDCRVACCRQQTDPWCAAPPAPLLQCPDKHQKYISHVLGVPMHKVVVRTKRLGEAPGLPRNPAAAAQSSAHRAYLKGLGLGQWSAPHVCSPCSAQLRTCCTYCALRSRAMACAPCAYESCHPLGTCCWPVHQPAKVSPLAGGGFGGKESRSGFINAAAAVPAYHLRRAVRCM